MLNTFLEKAEGLLNRNFVVAYWLPTFVAFVLGLVPRVYVWGIRTTLAWWAGLASGEDTSGQLWTTLLFLLAVTLVAYLLQTFTRPVLQFFEGYRFWPGWLQQQRIAHHIQQMKALREKILSEETTASQRAQAQDKLSYQYPPRPDQLLPTRLGNTIKAAESYGEAAYKFDMPFWWPRLWSLLPEEERGLVQDALTGLVALLNLALLLFYVGIDNSVYLLRCAPGWTRLWVLAALGGAWVLAWLCYQGAVVQARSYGVRLRAVVDLYRFELLTKLRQPLPKTPLEERKLWPLLKEWLYNGSVGPVFHRSYTHAEEASAAASEEETTEKAPSSLLETLRKFL
jgi:hypothetical protein